MKKACNSYFKYYARRRNAVGVFIRSGNAGNGGAVSGCRADLSVR